MSGEEDESNTMTDQTDQSVEGTTASDQPGGNGSAPDLEQMVTRIVAAAMSQQEQRFQGFQSLIDRKLSKLSTEFKTALASPEEREQLGSDANEAEIERLRRENELFRMRDTAPKGATLLAKLLDADTLDDQVALLESALTPQQQTQVAEALTQQNESAQTPVPEVDRNSPPRPVTPGVHAAEDGEMTEEIADALLANAGKGALRGY